MNGSIRLKQQGKENEKYIILLKVFFEKGRGSYSARRLKNKFAGEGVIISR